MSPVILPWRNLLCLVWVTQRLRHYMMYHATLLIFTMGPLKYLFEKPALLGRLARWHLLLAEFDISCYAKICEKGKQSLIIWQKIWFMVVSPRPTFFQWIHFEGAINTHKNGIGAILIFPTSAHFMVAIKLKFPCTNKVAKYKACICRKLLWTWISKIWKFMGILSWSSTNPRGVRSKKLKIG